MISWPVQRLFPLWVLRAIAQSDAIYEWRRGKLVYVDKDHGLDFSCEPECRFACQDYSVGQVLLLFTRTYALLLRCKAGLTHHLPCVIHTMLTLR